ncbi:MAG: hypothetical protein AAB254_07225, partial [candidate division NC10 bacterium]
MRPPILGHPESERAITSRPHPHAGHERLTRGAIALQGGAGQHLYDRCLGQASPDQQEIHQAGEGIEA